jgi:hypothetical protein
MTGKAWSDDEVLKLIYDTASGKELSKIAEEHQRTPLVIQCKLKQLITDKGDVIDAALKESNRNVGVSTIMHEYGLNSAEVLFAMSNVKTLKKPWTVEEDNQLLQEFSEGMILSQISKNHDRTIAAINARYKKLTKQAEGKTAKGKIAEGKTAISPLASAAAISSVTPVHCSCCESNRKIVESLLEILKQKSS